MVVHRIEPLVDPSFRMPSDVQTTTPDGEPWLRWAHVGDRSGWYVLGDRTLVVDRQSPFWEIVLSLGTMVGNGALDAVHVIGDGIISVGGLGFNATSGVAQRLLQLALEKHPSHWLSAMGPLLVERLFWMDDGVIRTLLGGPITDPESLNELVRAGSDGRTWTSAQKRRAKTWSICTSRMLRHDAMVQAQVQLCEEQAMSQIPRELVRWPDAGVRDLWMHTPELQALWLVAILCGYHDSVTTRKVLRATMDRFDAEGSMGRLRTAIDLTEEPFRWRAHRVAELASELYGLETHA